MIFKEKSILNGTSSAQQFNDSYLCVVPEKQTSINHHGRIMATDDGTSVIIVPRAIGNRSGYTFKRQQRLIQYVIIEERTIINNKLGKSKREVVVERFRCRIDQSYLLIKLVVD